MKKERRRTTLRGILSFVMENNNCNMWCIALRFHRDPQPNNQRQRSNTHSYLRAYEKDKIKEEKKANPCDPTRLFIIVKVSTFFNVFILLYLFRWVSNFYDESNWMHSLVLSVAMCLRFQKNVSMFIRWSNESVKNHPIIHFG